MCQLSAVSSAWTSGTRASQQLTAMAATIAFLLIIATTIAGATADWKSLHVKYALWDGYYAIPVTASKIVKEGFVKMGRDADLNADLYTLADDPRMIALFDTHGNIAGLRTSYIKDDVGKRSQPFPYSYDANPMMTSATYQGKNLWYATVLFVSPEMLKAGGRKDTGGLVAEDIYLKLDGNWTKISKDECKVEAQGFTKQACFIGMGMHYFYKVTPTSECEHFQGAFLLYESGELIGLGFNPFGTFTSSPKRTWFEDVPADVVTDIVPNGPPCIKDWVSKYGATSFHIFFKGFPRLTFCSWPWQKSDQCKG